MCQDESVFVHNVRKIAGRLIHDRRRYLLKDYDGFILEGPVKFTEFDGTLSASIDYSDVAGILKHHYKEGRRVRLLAIPTDEFENFDVDEEVKD